MDNQEFQKLVIKQFGIMNEQFTKIDERFTKIDEQLKDIKVKLVDHDKRFDNLDTNIDIVARHTSKLMDTQDEVGNVYSRRR